MYLLRHFLFFLLFVPCTSVFAREGENVQQPAQDTLKVKAWIKESKKSIRSDYAESLMFADSALILARAIGHQRLAAKANEQKGTAALQKSDFETAGTCYREAIEYYQKVGEKKNAAIILGNLGIVKRNLGRYDEAMECFFEALAVKQSFNATKSLPYTYIAISETYAIKDMPEKAEEYFKLALKGFQSIGDTLMANSVLLNMGGYSFEQGKYEQALPLIMQAKKYFEANGPINEEARANYILGGLLLEKNEISGSEEALLTAKSLFDTLNSAMRSTGCLIKLNKIALLKGDTAKALAGANKALALSHSIGTDEQATRTLIFLYEIYKSKGDYRKALHYREQYEQLNDSINNHEAERKIVSLEKEYQNRLKEKELAELTAKNALSELTLKKQKVRQYALIGLIILVLLTTVIIFNQYRTKKRNHDILLEKNNLIQLSLNEKEVLLREIHHRVKNNMQFISSLLHLQSRHVQDEQTLRVLNEGRNRINSMALLHQKLYQEDDLKGVDMQSYIENLTHSLIHSYKIDRSKLQVVKEIHEINLDIDIAIPIGLILNELITNALKYAFHNEEQGQLKISLLEKEEILELKVSDNGKGLPDNFDREKTGQFGFELIHSLAGKLKAEIEIRNNPGVEIKLQFINSSKPVHAFG